ncbi:MAG: Flp pilus assembly complex ATPase component TadA [Candidatus Omnitrophota bacterium]|nr:MAG: Flp pilus assembly complex ATPase component TadA [Candidatus Omnitrophota bacterium]
MPNSGQVKLGEILVSENIISQSQLNEFLKEHEQTGRFIGEIIADSGVTTEEEITRLLSSRLGFAFVDLADIIIEPKAVELVPEEVWLKFNALGLYIVHDTLTVAMANPLDTEAIDEIQSISNLKVKAVFASLGAIRSALTRQCEPAEGVTSVIARPVRKIFSNGARKPEYDKACLPDRQAISSLKQAASLAPVVEMVNALITRAVEMKASDIHLEPQRTSLNCRYRIDGILHLNPPIPFEYQAAVISRIKIMANMDIAEKRLPQDGRICMPVAGREVDLRISTFPTIHGENLVIRILDRARGIFRFSQLGFSTHALDKFSQLIRRPYGIILVTGPTGSGKTSTLYAALSEINTTEKNVITLEDPVEYEIPNVRQSQVNIKARLTFASGLRSMIRQDPDIIMIGEIRDKETADIAIHAALTGHMVFSTLHTNDAPSAVTRLIDMGVEPFLVSSSVIGILAQRLVRLLCPSCKQEYTPSKELLASVIARVPSGRSLPAGRPACRTGRQGNFTFYQEAGCKKCKQCGYIGRTGIFELLIPNDEIKELITKKPSATILREAAVRNGMKTLRQAGVEKVLAGFTSTSELLRVTEEA